MCKAINLRSAVWKKAFNFSLYDLYSFVVLLLFWEEEKKILFFTFVGMEKVKDYGVTSCVEANVNKYNFG